MKILRGLFYLFSPIIFGAIVGYLTRGDLAFLGQVERTIKITNIVFSIVWGILYLLMGIWSYLEDKNESDKLVCVYLISLGINILFNPLLFSFHLIFIALIDVMVLISLILYIFIQDKSKKRYLLLPYLIWLLIALILMVDLTINNVLIVSIAFMRWQFVSFSRALLFVLSFDLFFRY